LTVRDLDNRHWHASDISDVIEAAGAKLSTGRHPQVISEYGLHLEFCRVPFTLRRVHTNPSSPMAFTTGRSRQEGRSPGRRPRILGLDAPSRRRRAAGYFLHE